MCLEVLKPPQVDGLASPELAYYDPHHGVVRPGREVAICRFAGEVDELAEDILDVGP